MWKYLTKDETIKFILSLNLIDGNLSDTKKLNILYAIANHPEKYYTKKYINKKDGTAREILIPNPLLKKIQKNILNHVLYGLSVSKYACAYVKKKSLIDNASVHVNQKIILKMDLKDFFSSILFEQIYNALPNEILPPSIKVLIVKLCTYQDYLPQGTPTSPYLSNLVMKNFDDYIGSYCLNKNIHYTRYSDDLTFSGIFNIKDLKNKVQACLENMGFNINISKTKVIKRYHRQTITGLVVNEKLNINKDYQNKIRQEMFYIKKYGLDNHIKYLGINKEKYLLSLKGRIDYCYQITKSKKMLEYKNFLI